MLKTTPRNTALNTVKHCGKMNHRVAQSLTEIYKPPRNTSVKKKNHTKSHTSQLKIMMNYITGIIEKG